MNYIKFQVHPINLETKPETDNENDNDKLKMTMKLIEMKMTMKMTMKQNDNEMTMKWQWKWQWNDNENDNETNWKWQWNWFSWFPLHPFDSTFRPVYLGFIARAFFQAISNCMTSHDKSLLVFHFGFPSESHVFS